MLSESLTGWEAVAYKQQHTDSWVLLIFINERLWVYEWRLSEILSKLKVFAHSEGEQALAALQRRRQRWMLSERVHGVWLCRVSALHQSLPPWHLASPPCGWSSVNHQLLKGGQKKSDALRQEPGCRRRKTFTFCVSMLSKMLRLKRKRFCFFFSPPSMWRVISCPKEPWKDYLSPHVCPRLSSVLLVFKKTTTPDRSSS